MTRQRRSCLCSGGGGDDVVVVDGAAATSNGGGRGRRGGGRNDGSFDQAAMAVAASKNTGTAASSSAPRNRAPICQRTWRVWRYCCCRYGYYPIIVAPVVTAACLLSLYSSSGCEMVDLEIGFVPSNSYNKSEALLGFFFYGSGVVHDNEWRERVHGGCENYPPRFEADFIENDRTWKVARVMAMIAGVSSLLCALSVWVIVFVPLPVSIVWPGILLPLIMLSFIAEGSKFLIFDIALCSNAIWLPTGVDSLPQSPESCTLGKSAIYGIAAAALFLVGLLLICLHTPEQRMLDPDYGISYATGTELALAAAAAAAGEDPTDSVDDYRRGSGGGGGSNVGDNDVDYINGDVESDFDVYTHGGNSSIDPSHMDDVPSHESSNATTTTGEGSSTYNKNHLAMSSARDGGNDGAAIATAGVEDGCSGEPSGHRVSESRVSKMEELEMNALAGTDSLLHDLVSDLNASLAADDGGSGAAAAGGEGNTTAAATAGSSSALLEASDMGVAGDNDTSTSSSFRNRLGGDPDSSYNKADRFL